MYLCIVRACSEDFRCVDLPECNHSLRVTLDKTSLTADTAFFPWENTLNDGLVQLLLFSLGRLLKSIAVSPQ